VEADGMLEDVVGIGVIHGVGPRRLALNGSGN
jgi:hypothetical protein